MRVGGKIVKPPPSVAKVASDDDQRAGDPSAPEPTRDEARNGWTRESLNEYLRSRATQQEEFQREFTDKRRQAASQTTSKFDPHRWGG